MVKKKKNLEKLVKRSKEDKSVRMVKGVQEAIFPIPFCYSGHNYEDKNTKLSSEELADGLSNILNNTNPIYQSGPTYKK